MNEWTQQRDAWLEAADGVLAADERVVGWALVGSFGTGSADAWSDLDLLVVVRDETDVAGFTEIAPNELLCSAALIVDARRNAPRGARSLASVHLRESLPVGVDWYVYPQAAAAWPADADVRLGQDRVERTAEPFAEWNTRGERNEPLPASPEQEQAGQLAMVIVAGKYLARASPEAVPIVDWLTSNASTHQAPAEHLDRLRAWIGREFPQGAVMDALGGYLDLVAAHRGRATSDGL